jgi:hypothetical protein
MGMNLRLLICTAALASSGALGQSGNAPANPFVGTWKVVSILDGDNAPVFGPNSRGMMILAPDGHYTTVQTRADLPRFVSNNRQTGTADENQAIVRGSLATFGRYSVDPAAGVLTMTVEGSTWPAWVGDEQKRKFTLQGDELRWQTITSGRPPGQVVWKRVK